MLQSIPQSSTTRSDYNKAFTVTELGHGNYRMCARNFALNELGTVHSPDLNTDPGYCPVVQSREVNESRVRDWESRAEVPLLLLAAAFLVAYAWPVLDPDLNPDLEQTLSVSSWAVWAAFSVDFLIRVALAADRPRYVTHHWYDVALIAVPMLRPLRLLRLLAFARILNRSAVGSLSGRVSVYVGGSALAAVGLGALAVLDAERGQPDANITTVGDALWWACTTVTTVGYGDHFPVTTSGRVVAVALMLVGIALVGSLTAVIAAWLVEHVEIGHANTD